MLLLVMSLVDGIGQVKGIELMVKYELPTVGGTSQLTPLEVLKEGGPSCTLIGVLSSHRRQYGWTLSSLTTSHQPLTNQLTRLAGCQ